MIRKIVLIAAGIFHNGIMANEINWIEHMPGFSTGTPSVEAPIKINRPGVTMTYRIRMPITNCWTNSGQIKILDLNEEKVLSTVELAQPSKATELYFTVLCSVVSKP